MKTYSAHGTLEVLTDENSRNLSNGEASLLNRRMTSTIMSWGLETNLSNPLEINAVILADPRQALKRLQNNSHLNENHIRAIIANARHEASNFAYLATLIANNTAFPQDLLQEFAETVDYINVLKAISLHSSASEETKVLAAMRVAALSNTAPTDARLQ